MENARDVRGRLMSLYFQSSKSGVVKRHVLEEVFLPRFQIGTLLSSAQRSRRSFPQSIALAILPDTEGSMRFSCLLVASLLSSLPAAAFAAQPVDYPQADRNGTVLPAPPSSTTVQFFAGSNKPLTPPILLDNKALAALREKTTKAAHDATAQNDTLCYSIESYRFRRESRDSDAMRPSGHSDCAPASEFHLKPVMRSQPSAH
jgi:hypothetical protein